MSDVSQGPGWWFASDGKWYPPESAVIQPPPSPSTPPPPFEGVSITDSSSAPIATEVSNKATRTRIIGGISIAVVVVAAIVWSALPDNSQSGSASAVSATYLSAYNKFVAANNAALPKENSNDPTTQSEGLNAEATALRAFDAAVTTMTFPQSAMTDVRQLSTAEGVLESELGTLANNTDNVDAYNSVFPTAIAAQATFRSAAKTVGVDLGVSIP